MAALAPRERPHVRQPVSEGDEQEASGPAANLRSVLAGGPDVRDYAHPEWNDSIGIGFNPDAGPGTPRR